MIIYSSDVSGFLKDSFHGSLVERLDRLVRKQYQGSSGAEIRSWRNSLSYMERVISNSSIPRNSGIAIEYMIPSTSKRIDFIVTGFDTNKKSSVVVIELKQWDDVKLVKGKDAIVKTYVGNGLREVPHPSYQAYSYTKLLEDFNASIQDNEINLYPCAYLHNYLIDGEKDPLVDEQYKDILKKAPIYDSTGAPELVTFLNKFIKYGDNRQVLYYVEEGRIRPSKSLQDSLNNMLKGNQEFTMIDDQKIVFENVVAMAEKSRRDKKKRVMIVEGGPGTGKSVVSVNLLAELTNRTLVAQYITKNAAPRKVYRTKLKGSMKMSSVDNLFVSSGAFVDVEQNTLDIAIVDEAHRLTKKSNMFGRGENQIKEIIESSQCSVFFVDDRQVISTKDIGKKSEIEKWAIKLGAEVEHEKLESQFRCNGSDGYLAWIDDVLEIRETANKWFDIDYDFDVVDSPQELLDWVKSKNKNNKARVIAGYCWEWPKEERRNSDFQDIRIEEHDFGIAWNLDEGIWAIDETTVNEAGCIHTSQGLEFEYVGIIIGPDMFYKNNQVQTNFFNRANSDASIRGLKKLFKENPDKAQKIGDEIIRNTYRTLLTRGMKGCRVFCTDTALAEYLKTKRSSQDIYEYVSNEHGNLEVAEGSVDYEVDY